MKFMGLFKLINWKSRSDYFPLDASHGPFPELNKSQTFTTLICLFMTLCGIERSRPFCSLISAFFLTEISSNYQWLWAFPTDNHLYCFPQDDFSSIIMQIIGWTPVNALSHQSNRPISVSRARAN